MAFNIDFPDVKAQYRLNIRNGVLHNPSPELKSSQPKALRVAMATRPRWTQV
jgi:hypothetical protein